MCHIFVYATLSRDTDIFVSNKCITSNHERVSYIRVIHPCVMTHSRGTAIVEYNKCTTSNPNRESYIRVTYSCIRNSRVIQTYSSTTSVLHGIMRECHIFVSYFRVYVSCIRVTQTFSCRISVLHRITRECKIFVLYIRVYVLCIHVIQTYTDIILSNKCTR